MLWNRRLPASPPHPEPRSGGGGWAGAATHTYGDWRWASLQQHRERNDWNGDWEQQQQHRILPGLPVWGQTIQSAGSYYPPGATLPRPCGPTDYRRATTSVPVLAVPGRGWGAFQDPGPARPVLPYYQQQCQWAASAPVLPPPSLPYTDRTFVWAAAGPPYSSASHLASTATPQPLRALPVPANLPAYFAGSLREHGQYGLRPPSPPFSSLPTLPSSAVCALPHAAHTLGQRGSHQQAASHAVALAAAPTRTLPSRPHAHAAPGLPPRAPTSLRLRQPSSSALPCSHSAASSLHVRHCPPRAAGRPVSAPVSSIVLHPPSPPPLPFTPPFLPPYPSYASLPSPPPAPRPPFSARGAARALAGSDWSHTWGDGHGRTRQIQTYQPDQHGSVSRGKSRAWGSLKGPLVVGGGTAARLEEAGGSRAKGGNHGSGKKKRSLLRLCYFHLRFPQV